MVLGGMKRLKWTKKSVCIVFIVSLMAIGHLVLGMGWVKPPKNFIVFNKTESLPPGYYVAVPMNEIHTGDLVVFDLPEDMKCYAVDRGWMGADEPLLKKVGAVEGDTFQVDDRFFSINGKYVGPIFNKDSQGLPMPKKLRGSFEVPKGYILPIAPRRPNSFDGRYFGAVPLSSVKAKVIPLITF